MYMTSTDFLSSRFHYSFAAHPPTLDVRPGARLRVICPDCDNAMADGTLLTSDQRKLDAPDTVEGNPLAGPIYVEGAEPGDTLSVRIDAIELDRDSGITLLAPDHGLLKDHHLTPPKYPHDATKPGVIPRHMYHWHIDTESGTATIRNPIGDHPLSLPLDPFIGCIGVSPSLDSRIDSLHCGPSGGNYDLPMFRPGTTVFLPVNHRGALLMMGDLHAAQGHGEVIGGGIETSGKIVCTLGVIKRMGGQNCRMCDPKTLWSVGTHGDLRRAIQIAYAGLLDWVAQPGVADRYDMYNLLSQCATVTVGNLNEAPYPAAAGVLIDHLPTAVKEAISSWIK